MIDAHTVAAEADDVIGRLSRRAGNEEEALHSLASRLREVSLDDETCVALARTLRIPVSMVEAWLADLAELLEAGSAYLLDDEVVELLVDRLSVLRWAWIDPPESWPSDVADEVREDWRSDLERVLT